MEKLRELLNAECNYRMKDETMDMFLALMTELEFKANEPVIPFGKFDSNLYVLKEGIIRISYFDGFKEKTHAFALPGTVFISYYSLIKDEPAFCKIEACCKSVVMKVAKVNFIDFMKRSNDFAQWMSFIFMEQLRFYEKKLEIMNGSAKERFEALIKNRPEIMEHVSSKIIASYIGISPEYLSRLKRYFTKS